MTDERPARSTLQLRVNDRWRKVSGHRVTVPRGAQRPALRLHGVDRGGHTERAFSRVAVDG